MRNIIPRPFERSLFDLVFSDFLTPEVHSLKGNLASFSPNCDLLETDSDYVFKVDLPGLKKEDLKIELKGKYLVVSGERREDKESANSRIVERSHGKFQRAVYLVSEILEDSIQAEFKDGVLKVNIPKVTTKKNGTKEITIKD